MEKSKARLAGKTVTFEALATESLDSRYTDDLFIQYESLFAEVCARWISSGQNSGAKILAFSRIIPLAPYLAEHAERFLKSNSQSSIFGSHGVQHDLSDPKVSDILPDLLGVFRLLSFNCLDFARYVCPSSLQSLFRHSNLSVRYLAVRSFCLYVHAADHATEHLIERHLGTGKIEGEWEGQTIDYRFLSLWEEKRWSKLQSLFQDRPEAMAMEQLPHLNRQLSPYTVNVNGVLLPRLDGAPSYERPAELISTPTTDS